MAGGYRVHTYTCADAFEYNCGPQLYDPAVLPYRTTLLHKGDSRFEIFECGDFWEGQPVKDTGSEPTKIVTMLHKNPVVPRDLGKLVDVFPRLPDGAPLE